MTPDGLRKRAYELCLLTGRYEIVADLGCMDCLQLTGLIAWLMKLQGG